MLLQLIYNLSGKSLVALGIELGIFAVVYLILIYKVKVTVGTLGNLASCLAGIISPLAAAFAGKAAVFGILFSLRFIAEAALILLAVAALVKTGKKKPFGIVIILGNYMFCTVLGSMIPIAMEYPKYWTNTAIMVGIFLFFMFITSSDVSTSQGTSVSAPKVHLPGSGYYEYDPIGEMFDEKTTIHDKVTGENFYYSMGYWRDEDGNIIPSAVTEDRGLDDFYNKHIAAHNPNKR